MPRIKLTDAHVAKTPAVPGKQLDLFDSVVPGLVLRITSGKRLWTFIYRRPQDRSKKVRMRVGAYPGMNLVMAREKALKLSQAVEGGKDPTIADPSEQKLGELLEIYAIDHLRTLRTGAEVERRLHRNIIPALGNLPLNQITKRGVTGCLDAVKRRGAAVEANRTYEDLRAMFNWIVGRGQLDASPLRGLKRPTKQERRRDRVLSEDEIKHVWHSLPLAPMTEGSRNILRLLVLTLQRHGEVAGMHVRELDLEAGVWLLPPERVKNNKAHTVFLSDLATRIIREQLADVARRDEHAGRKASGYVFPGDGKQRETGHQAGARIPRALLGEGTVMGMAAWTPHDLRRSGATALQRLGVSTETISWILNHVSARNASITLGVYARHDFLAERKAAMQLWADKLREIVGSADII